VHRAVTPQVQDFTLKILELRDTSLCSVLQLVKVPQNSSMTTRYISHSSQFCVVCKHAEGMLHLVIRSFTKTLNSARTTLAPILHPAVHQSNSPSTSKETRRRLKKPMGYYFRCMNYNCFCHKIFVQCTHIHT